MSTPDSFQRAEDEYFRLKGQLAAGRITQAQFEAALRDLMVTDAQGRSWIMGVETGKWFVHDGARWVEANPFGPGQPAAGLPHDLPEAGPRAVQPIHYSERKMSVPPAEPVRSSGGCGGCLVRGCLLLIVLVVVLVGGGYLAIQSGAVTTGSLLALAGLGPATVEINNFRDDAITARFHHVSETPTAQSNSDTFSLDTELELNPFDVKLWHTANPGRYTVQLIGPTGRAIGACTLTLRGGDRYQFVTLPERTVVHRLNAPPQRGADLILTTTALCR